MLEIPLQIEFLSDWHVGSGLGDGAIADAILNRDVNGIPSIPGSAIKGALREGAWRLAIADRAHLEKLVDFLFGTAQPDKSSNRPGRIFASGGRLRADIYAWLESLDGWERKEFVRDMTILRFQTRLDARKMVEPHTLRSIECGIPGLAFTATLAADVPAAAEDWLKGYLAAICACVKSIGGHRARGLGRCRLKLAGMEDGAALPPPAPECLLAKLNS
ncbi:MULTISPECIES: RAMP superfamily CRISPR-associated protein [unclassified Desulfovibrio]|uniref:RAMP superfamily CRISPR-associated protein n=1 Tax=unclassified Desulfovibrio TaxID=2593640 RepID=UPI0013EA5BFC|nr:MULTISPECIES: RAMP superfamily CRISPR-associated protein [unclassified Desulfovibrio]